MKQHIINIGRQFGSGGRQIGEALAKKMNFSFYDKELIHLASKESGLGKEFFEKFDEKSRFGLLGGFLGFRTGINADEFVNSHLNHESLFRIQSNVIRELAEQQSCVFVGRCADYILREYPLCINVFITADLDDRIERVAKRQNIHKDKIPDLLEKTDKRRAEYYNFYTNKTWGNAKSYHICINSSVLGIDETVEAIIRFAKHRFGTLATPASSHLDV
ncbi:MAG: cytidylate kinase-like family protein [Bacteroidales bacterium]|jgi:cytidylate kinase|nr:cytidylate kinase-like family protein [Bacteroidales bacterium]